MALPNAVFELGIFLSAAQNLSRQQLTLNREYKKRLEEFLPLLQVLQVVGSTAGLRDSDWEINRIYMP